MGGEGTQLGFTAALCMEDNAGLPASVNALNDCLAGEELGIAHDVLFHQRVSVLINSIDIAETVLEEIQHTGNIEERGNEAIARGVRVKIRLELLCVRLTGVVTIIPQNVPNSFHGYFLEPTSLRGFLAEEGETGLVAVRRGVERACTDFLCRSCIIVGLILHIVAECDELEHIEILAELRHLQTFVKHPMKLFLNAAFVVRLFNLQETKGDTIHQYSDVWAERTLFLWAKEQLVHDGKIIVGWMVEINEFHIGSLAGEAGIEFLAHIIVLDDAVDFSDDGFQF